MIKDKRDLPFWVVVELNKLGEDKITEGSLKRLVLNALGIQDESFCEIFIPVLTFNKGLIQETFHVMEGYFFIQTGLEDTAYFKLEQLPFIEQVLSDHPANSLRTLSVVSDSYICMLKQQMHDVSVSRFEVGDTVTITEGVFSKMSGEILEIYETSADVFISLRSLKVVYNIPSVFLKESEDPDEEIPDNEDGSSNYTLSEEDFISLTEYSDEDYDEDSYYSDTFNFNSILQLDE